MIQLPCWLYTLDSFKRRISTVISQFFVSRHHQFIESYDVAPNFIVINKYEIHHRYIDEQETI
jgi:hypothetical protein